MSRLFVKNLPNKISTDDIKRHFSQKAIVTDVKLVYKDGEFRRFGFVGFENEADASKVCKYFNNTFIKQAKISVEVCKDLNAADRPASWREKNKLKKQIEKGVQEKPQPVDKKTEKKNLKKGQDPTDKLKSYEGDLDFKEYLKANNKEFHQIKSPEKAHEDNSGNDSGHESDQEETEEKKIADNTDVSDLDYLKSLKTSSNTKDGEDKPKKTLVLLEEHFQVRIRTKEKCKIRQKGSVGFTKLSVKQFFKPLKCRSIRIPQKMKFVAYVGFKTEKELKKAVQKDKSFLNGARVNVQHYTRHIQKDSDVKTAPWQSAEERLKKSESVAESGKLFIRNLWYSVTEDDIRQEFEQYGQLADVTLPICKITRKPKGFATVTYMFPEHSVRAMTELDGKTFKGRVLHILPALTQEDDNGKEPTDFKEKKEKEQKATAGSWHNWNTLFLGSGAVIDVMSEKYNRSKMEILHGEGKQSVAVNLALGESQIVDETRRFLEENGIALDAFTNPGVQRSKTVIIAKNLPANTKAQELSRIFSRYGEIGRLVLPPAGVTAIIEYLDPSEAKKGFRSLAYSKFHYLPLYLEWAPERIFKNKFEPKPAKTVNTDSANLTQQDKSRDTSKNADNPDPSKKVDKSKEKIQAAEPNATLYVKNLSFTTTQTALEKHFEKVGPVLSVLISMKKGQSQGYGFVQYVRQADAKQALIDMQDSVLEDRNLEVKLSEKILETTVKSSRMMHDVGVQNSTKIMVKNVPFEASRKEVRQLFATFGELKTVRLPNKQGSQEHRGFGFIDFLTKEEAKKAFEALCHSTHLYGRRLVLEWAKDDESVDELRQRTAEQFLGREGPPLKKKRIADALEYLDSRKDDD